MRGRVLPGVHMGLPELHYWFTGTALYMALSSIFAAVVAVIGIRSMISRRWFGFLMLAALVLSFLAWKEAAKQGRDSKEQAAANATLSASIKELQGNSGSQGKQLSRLLSQNGQLLSQNNQLLLQNSQLKDAVVKIAKAANAPEGASLAQLTELIEEIVPRNRHLSAHQKEAILSNLGIKAQRCVVEVHAEWSTPEVEDYAREFQAVLIRANWMATQALHVDLGGGLASGVGITVAIKDASHIPPCTIPLIRALQHANLNVKTGADPSDIVTVNDVWVGVGEYEQRRDRE
jgi:hypothetical protein